MLFPYITWKKRAIFKFVISKTKNHTETKQNTF